MSIAASCGVGGDDDLDVHSQVIGWKPRPGAMERYGLAYVVHDSDTNEVAAADDPTGWIAIDPTGSGQIDLSPGVRIAGARVAAIQTAALLAARLAFVAVIADLQISGDEARRHPERAHGLDHQHGKVATTPASECECLRRGLDALRIPAYVLEGSLDAGCQVVQKREGIGRPIVSQKCSSPALDLAVRVDRLSFDEADQIRHFFRAVDERTGAGELLDIEVANVCGRMIKTNRAVEPKLLGTGREAHDVHIVVERVPRPANACRCRGDHKLCVHQTLVMAVSRTQHHPVLAEGN